MKKRIFIVTGRSGSGKDTVLKEVLNRIPKLNHIVPVTTRPKRKDEKFGESYFFISKENMEKLISSNALLEYRKYDVIINDKGDTDVWYYGHEMPKSDNSILIGTPEVVDNLNSMSDEDRDYELYPIYINADDEDILYRLITREEKNDTKNWKELIRRYFKDEKDFELVKSDDTGSIKYKWFLNLDLNTCVNNICDFINEIIKEGK